MIRFKLEVSHPANAHWLVCTRLLFTLISGQKPGFINFMHIAQSCKISDLALPFHTILIDALAQHFILAEGTPEEVNLVPHGYLAQLKELSVITQVHFESHAGLFVLHGLLLLLLTARFKRLVRVTGVHAVSLVARPFHLFCQILP